MSKQRQQNKGRFAGVPLSIMESSAYVTLPPVAKCLLYELATQYNGRNNGYLSLTRDDLKVRGFPSNTTNSNAIKALLESNLVMRTKHGGIGMGRKSPHLYALGWQEINERIDKPLDDINQPKGGLINYLLQHSEKVKIVQR